VHAQAHNDNFAAKSLRFSKTSRTKKYTTLLKPGTFDNFTIMLPGVKYVKTYSWGKRLSV